MGGRRHALRLGPRDPLCDYHLRPDASAEFVNEVAAGTDADVLVLGHTHWPLLRTHGELQMANPGSVGQPLDGDPRAAYAVWEDGKITPRRAKYDQAPVLTALGRLPIDRPLRDALGSMLRLARLDGG
ncbi:MAG: metallophosphoesterase family protein [Planctomycetota bacterium]